MSNQNTSGSSSELDICAGHQVPYSSAPTSWWGGWSPVYTGNKASGTQVPYTQIASRVNTTGKLVNMDMTLHFGDHLLYTRRNRVYLWVDYRVLINGAPVLTRASASYWYEDEINDTAPNIVPTQQYQLRSMGMAMYSRNSIPIGATISVEVQSRWQVVGAQSDAYARYIGGLRSHASINLHLQNFVVGETD